MYSVNFAGEDAAVAVVDRLGRQHGLPERVQFALIGPFDVQAGESSGIQHGLVVFGAGFGLGEPLLVGAGDVVQVAAVAEIPADAGDEPAALGQTQASAPAGRVGLQLAGLQIEERRQLRATGDNQSIADDCQISLGSQPGVTPDAMVPVACRDAIDVGIRPDDRSRFGVQGVHEYAFRGPQPGSEVDDAIRQHGTATGGKQRDQPAVSDDLAICLALGQAPELPTEGTVVGVQAIQIPVIRNEVNLALGGHGSEANRRLGKETPAFGARFGVQCRYAVGDHRGHEHRVAEHHRLVGGVVAQSEFKRKRRARRRQLARPAKLEVGGQFVRGGCGAA